MTFQKIRCALVAVSLGALPVHAEDLLTRSADNDLWLSGGVGLLNIEAHEYVYLGDNKASQLDWDTDGVVLYNASAGADLGKDWYVKGKLELGLGGDGHMVDYDWVPGFAIDQSMDGWSDRSVHPDTRLDYYFSGTAEVAGRFSRTKTAISASAAVSNIPKCAGRLSAAHTSTATKTLVCAMILVNCPTA